MATPQQLQQSIQKGLAWLAPQQNSEGSWGDSYRIGTTGLVLLKLIGYAVENNISPFSDEYIYHENVILGLDYLFSEAKQDANGVYFEESGHINYEVGLVLSALCVTATPSRVINVVGSVVNGKTYKQMADLMIQYLTYSQDPNGGWAYELGDTPDNSVSGYVCLGLEIASTPLYNFNCIIPVGVKTKLNNWIDYIQNDTNGGSGYQDPNYWYNILKTGNLIQQMRLYGDSLANARVQFAINYIATRWNYPVATFAGDLNEGWRDINNPSVTIDYQATFTTMKGLSGYGVEKIGATNIDWFTQMSDAVIAQQNANGSWPKSIWDYNSPQPILSTAWALLTLEKELIPIVEPEIPYVDTVTIKEEVIKCQWDVEEDIEIQGEVKLFAKKYKHSEAECLPGAQTKLRKGDDFGFTLVFGNYGEFEYIALNGKPTVEDTLSVPYPVYLKLMSLCLCDKLRLFNLTDNKPVEVCDKFYGPKKYKLQVQQNIGTEANPKWVADFNILCHSIYSISMLFQVEFPACPRCEDEEIPD